MTDDTTGTETAGEACPRCGVPSETAGHAFCLTTADLDELGLF